MEEEKERSRSRSCRGVSDDGAAGDELLEEIRKRQIFNNKCTSPKRSMNALRVTGQGTQDQVVQLNEKLDKMTIKLGAT